MGPLAAEDGAFWLLALLELQLLLYLHLMSVFCSALMGVMQICCNLGLRTFWAWRRGDTTVVCKATTPGRQPTKLFYLAGVLRPKAWLKFKFVMRTFTSLAMMMMFL